MIRVLTSRQIDDRTRKVLIEMTRPTEKREGMTVEVVDTNGDQTHRFSRELMKALGYRWVGGTFNSEAWFRPTDPTLFDREHLLIALVTYVTKIESVKIEPQPAMTREDILASKEWQQFLQLGTGVTKTISTEHRWADTPQPNKEDDADKGDTPDVVREGGASTDSGESDAPSVSGTPVHPGEPGAGT